MSVGSVFHSIESFFKKFLPTAAQDTQIALSTIQTFGPDLQLAFALIDPSKAAAAQPIISEITTDLGTVAGALAKGSTTGVSGWLGNIQSLLPQLFSEAHIKDPASLQRATGIGNAIIAEIQTIVSKLGS